MNQFAAIFEATTAFLRAKGIRAEFSKARKAARSAVEEFRAETGVPLPESFAVFFTDFANGCEFSWEKTNDPDDETWGLFAMPSLKQLAERRLNWSRRVRSHLDDRATVQRPLRAPLQAKMLGIWSRMESWVPFWDEGNGDHFCVEVESGRIVYDEHDWYDGFGSLTKTNGISAGENLLDFLSNWSRFCFLPNNNTWWGEFGRFGAIKWEPEFFDPEFCRSTAS